MLNMLKQGKLLEVKIFMHNVFLCIEFEGQEIYVPITPEILKDLPGALVQAGTVLTEVHDTVSTQSLH